MVVARLSELAVLSGGQLYPAEVDPVIHGVAGHYAELTAETVGRTLFVCMDEFLEYNRWWTWREQLDAAVAHKPAALLLPTRLENCPIPQIVVPNPRGAFASLAAYFSDYPQDQLRLIGVTGTNGKTTTSHLIAHGLQQLGVVSAVIGTLGAKVGNQPLPAGNYTTPLALELQRHLAGARRLGAAAVAMEVSSHGLALDRVAALRFDIAVVTNFGRDHLDFHGSESAYLEAKLQLLDLLRLPAACLILNRDMPAFSAFSSRLAPQHQLLTVSTNSSSADLRLISARPATNGSAGELSWRGQRFSFYSRLPGGFQLENWLCACAALIAYGFPPADALNALADFAGVCGRMEQIPLPNGALAIVDYAHNPHGLQALLETCKTLPHRRLHLVFGCGGDRDKGKRPLMGAIAAAAADFVTLTSDNPRSEDPQAILDDILQGFPSHSRSHASLLLIPDRAAAIRAAAARCGENDLLVVAGKGHEDYQIIGQQRFPFSDQAILRAVNFSA